MKNVSFRRNGVEFEPTKQELKIVLDDYAKQLAERDKRIADLERQLAESEKNVQVEEMLKNYGKEEIKKLHKRINEIVERDKNIVIELKQQLAEKEQAHMEAMENALNDFLTLRQELNQAKTDFAIEQIQKAWDVFSEEYFVNEKMETLGTRFLARLDQQIQELRG